MTTTVLGLHRDGGSLDMKPKHRIQASESSPSSGRRCCTCRTIVTVAAFVAWIVVQGGRRIADEPHVTPKIAFASQNVEFETFESSTTTNVSASISSLPACPESLPSDTRLLLLSNVQHYHGSTSILSLLMSSPQVATLCPNNSFQCEGY